jgi:hypothetical protein
MPGKTALSFSRAFLEIPAFTIVAVSLLMSTAIGQDVLTYHNNNVRTGLDIHETKLTQTNVKPSTFGLLFTLPADGLVDAEPLYISSLTVNGAIHNVVIVATEHDSVYAYDADNGKALWHVRTLNTGETPSDDRGCSQVTPEIGITSTPVIYRPPTGHPVIYLVAMSKDRTGDYHQRLHALDATSGAEVLGGPVEISAKHAGTGDNSNGGFVVFDPAQYKERAGLLMVGNTVYLAWASHCDFRPYTGWIMGYDARTLKQTTVLNVTPNGNEGAIWNAGAGMASDENGNIFLLDANGVFDETLNSSGFPSEGDYGNAFLRLTTKGGLAVADYFEMENEEQENNTDTDLGSGGALLTDQWDSNGKVWHLAVGAGKDGNLYVGDRTNMGKFSRSRNNIYQELHGALGVGIWSMPASGGGSLYYGPVASPILEFRFKDAKLLDSPVAQTAVTFPYPGATPSISTNNGRNAIVWATANTNPAVLYAFNAVTLKMLYNSNQAPNGRDHFGNGNKYITPMIANGKVYAASQTGVGVFGLLQ